MTEKTVWQELPPAPPGAHWHLCRCGAYMGCGLATDRCDIPDDWQCINCGSAQIEALMADAPTPERDLVEVSFTPDELDAIVMAIDHLVRGEPLSEGSGPNVDAMMGAILRISFALDLLGLET